MNGEIRATDGARLSYTVEGDADAPPLLLSNSLGTTRAMWERQMPALAKQFRVIRYDSRGHGESDAPPGPYDLATLARDAVCLLDALGVERASFCGVSLGGMVGQWLGAHAPERIERLVLANTAALMGPPSAWDARIETVRARGTAAIVEAVIERWFTPQFRAREPAAVAAIAEMLSATDACGYVASCAAIRDMDQRASLPAISRPTLVIAGSHDPATPPELTAQVAASVPGAQLAYIEAAHLSNVECPAEFNELVLTFLSQDIARTDSEKITERLLR